MTDIRTFVILNTTPKTAGSSLYVTLKTIPNIHLQHSHNIIKDEIEVGPGFFYNVIIKNKIQNIIDINHNNIILIDIVRFPIHRIISHFFQDLTDILKKTEEDIIKIYNTRGINYFINEFYKYVNIYDNKISFHDWNDIFNIDMYKNKFNFEEKMLFYKKNNMSFLIIRYEDINKWYDILKNNKYISVFKNMNKIHVCNIGNKKWYKNIYIAFKKNIKLNNMEIIFNKNKQYINHFYTKEEIQKYSFDIN